MLDLGQIRNEIDGIDKQLVELFEQRMKLTKEVAEYKIQTGKKVLDREREKAKIESVTKLVKNKENVHAIDDLFSQIMANSRKGQYQLLEAMGQTLRQPYEAIDEIKKDGVKIVYQGIPGAYTQEAACNFFGEDCDNYDVPTWRDVMEAVKNKEADYGVLPIENSTTGSVVGVYDLLQEYDNYIIAETFVNIDHVLVGLSGTDIDKERKDSLSMLLSALKNKAAQIYGLEVLKTGIADLSNNTTKFVIITNSRKFLKNANKTSIVFETANEAGTLYNLLSHIIYNGLNMYKIESRPSESKQWDYKFFVDFEGNIDDPRVMNALRGIEEEAKSIKLLGNY